MLIHASGTIKVEQNKGRIVVDLHPDILDYYGWFVAKAYWIKLHKPLHGAHITIASAKHHKTIDWQAAKKYHGQTVNFSYDPDMIRGGYTKGFIMFYMEVYSDTLDKIKDDVKVVENASYKGLHLTLGSGNKSGNKIRLYWPELITIK